MALLALPSLAMARERLVLSDGWQFSRDGISWQSVTVPHDWAIEGPFDKKWDLQVVAIEQNGEKNASEKSGRSGALPWIGEGIYRLNCRISKQYGHAELKFDGAMSEPVVFVNGKKVGEWAYGYNSFRIDVTRFLNFGGADNLIEVRLKNVEESSRWYPGAGLYRPVELLLSDIVHIDEWETFVRTSSLSPTHAVVDVDTKLEGIKSPPTAAAEIAIIDHQGRIVANEHADVDNEGRVIMFACVHTNIKSKLMKSAFAQVSGLLT